MATIAVDLPGSATVPALLPRIGVTPTAVAAFLALTGKLEGL